MSADDDQPTTSSEETKRKFLEALERKKQAGTNRPGVQDAGSGIRGAQGKAGGKREFRRKSG